MPADSRHVVTVGAADDAGKPAPYSAGGPPFGAVLLAKPEVLAYDAGQGTAEAVGFGAGVAGVAIGTGAPRCGLLEELGVRPGGLLRVPARWMPGR
jgi:hypothetical protein